MGGGGRRKGGVDQKSVHGGGACELAGEKPRGIAHTKEKGVF